jgi:hypothetical protein
MFLKPRATLLALWFLSSVDAKGKSGNSSYAVSSYQLSVRRLCIPVAFHPDQKDPHNPDRPSTISRLQEVFPRYSASLCF